MRKLTLADITPSKLLSTPVNRVIFINDRSGSMNGLLSRVTDDVNEKINLFKESDKTKGQKTFITIWDFDDKARRNTDNIPVENLPRYVFSGMGGGTALNDTVCTVIDHAKEIAPISTDESILILILTDGGECSSKYWGQWDVKNRVTSLPENWTITLIGPQGNLTWGRSVGIPDDNMLFWDGRSDTYIATSQATATGLGNYVNARSTGAKSVRTFYGGKPR